MSSQPSSIAMLGPNRNGAAPSMPPLTTSTTMAVNRTSSPSARMVHSNIGARGGQHHLEIATGQGSADALDIEAGGRLQHHRLPAELAGELEQAPAEIGTGSGEGRVDDEQSAAPACVIQTRRVSGFISRLLVVS